MKKKLIVAAMSMILVVGATITSFADTYDPQYPLKGCIESWFVQSPVTGTTTWKSDPYNFIDEPVGPLQYTLDLAIKDKNPRYLWHPSDNGYELVALTKLTDYPTIGLEGYDQGSAKERVDRLAEEIQNFLNSFDWRNASDYEKAVRIANRITQADYLSQEGTQYSYSCLVEGKANCDGYTDAAALLAACVGLPVGGLSSGNHVYPVFLVDGIWLAYEPTIKNDYFTVADVYSKNWFGNYQALGEYCEGTGYEIPTLESVETMFSDVRRGIIHGEQAPFIFFQQTNR